MCTWSRESYLKATSIIIEILFNRYLETELLQSTCHRNFQLCMLAWSTSIDQEDPVYLSTKQEELQFPATPY